MRLSEARSLCPSLVVCEYDFVAYRVVSEAIYRIFFQFTHTVQPVSCDEAYLEFPHWVTKETGEAYTMV